MTFELDWVHPRPANPHRRSLSIFKSLSIVGWSPCISICGIVIQISSKFTYEYINTIFFRFFSETVWLLQRNIRGNIRTRGLLTDMHFREYMEFTSKPILSRENGEGGIPWIPEHDVLKMVQWSTITSVSSIAITLTESNEVRRIWYGFGFTPPPNLHRKLKNPWTERKPQLWNVLWVEVTVSTNSSQYCARGKGCIYYYLAGCAMFPHFPAPIWQLDFLLPPVVSVIPVFFH